MKRYFIVLLLTLFLFIGCSDSNTQNDIEFQKNVGNKVDLNTGITAHIFKPYKPEKHVGYFILNHTQESISFSNQKFGMQVFEFDMNAELWKYLNLKYKIEEEIIIIPSNITNQDEAFQYHSLGFFDSLFLLKDIDKFRIYIQGEGVDSKTIYGAYLDID